MASKDAMYDAKVAAAAKAAATPKSGVIPGFKPSVSMPTAAKRPGEPGFVGPVASKPTTPSASVASVGPLGGLAAGVVAGVKYSPAPATPAETDKGAPVPPVVVDNGFDPVGKLLRYEAGKTTGYRVAVYADGKGGEFKGEETLNPVEPGSTGFETGGPKVTLARNTFANTMALLIGETEASQPWVDEMYDLTQGYINTGSDIEEAQNLALREARNKGTASKFVQRFAPIFKLQDRLNAGETVQVPSIADYVKAEQELGDVLRGVGLGDLATQEFAAKVFGDANKSVSEASLLISNVFNAIDNAPKALKEDLQILAPGVDRTSIARALLLGKEGAAALAKQIDTIGQVSAAKSQGVTIDMGTGADLAAGGATYGTSLERFATVKNLERGQQLGRMSNINFTQEDAIASTFQSSAAADEKIRKIKEEEQNRFRARSGYLPSQNRSRDF